jgi:hypothetical protein
VSFDLRAGSLVAGSVIWLLLGAPGCSDRQAPRSGGVADSGLDAASADSASAEEDAAASADQDADFVVDAALDAGPGDGGPGADERDADTADASDDARAGFDAADATDSAEAGPVVGLADLLERGVSTTSSTPRPGYGALVVASQGERSYVVESRRDAEPGPFGIPWRSRFRVAAYAAGHELWAFQADPDDVIGDVVAHPSGDITLAIEHFSAARDAYELVRLNAAGEVRKRSVLAAPTTIPASDYGSDDPQPLFRRKAQFSDATAAGWLRMLADGEGLSLAIMSFVDVPSSDHRANRRALGVQALDWVADTYTERWTRVVEGVHGAEPAAWAYDELRWREQAVRPFLARDDVSGDIVVGRAWNQSRCQANRSAFGEFSAEECQLRAVNAVENERLPLAVTRFSADGVRQGTCVLRPDSAAAEQLPFALAAHDGQLAVVGAVVRALADGSKKTYPDANGYVDYDGYVALYDRDGVRVRMHDFNLGRGDVLVALRWTERGIVAVGSSDWDRWQGGMSISRGASPLFVSLSPDGRESRQRLVRLGDASRHWNLHDLALLDSAVIGHGFSDAPMTHSADGVGSEARTFGPLQVRLAL